MQHTTVVEDRHLANPPNEEPGLRDYLVVLWRYRLLLLGVSILCGAVTFFVGKISPSVYEATVRLVVSPPKTVQVGEVVPAISVATFRAMIENQSLSAQLVKEFGLAAEPMRLTPQRFLNSALGIETPRDTNVVILRVRLPSADLASKVANRMAVLATELATRLSQDETIYTRDLIKAQVDLSRARLEAAEAKLRAFKQTAQIEALKKDVDAELEQRSDLLKLAVEIESERATLAKAEEELAKRREVRTVRRTIESEPALMEAAKEKGLTGASLIGLQTTNEYVSSVYDDIDLQIAESRAKLSGLERKKAELVDARKLGGAQLAKLNVLYDREAELARLQIEHDLSTKIYTDVATRYEQVRLQVSGRSAQLQLLDAALPPDRPVGPKVLRNTAAATVLAFVLVGLAVLFIKVVVR